MNNFFEMACLKDYLEIFSVNKSYPRMWITLRLIGDRLNYFIVLNYVFILVTGTLRFYFRQKALCCFDWFLFAALLRRIRRGSPPVPPQAFEKA